MTEKEALSALMDAYARCRELGIAVKLELLPVRGAVTAPTGGRLSNAEKCRRYRANRDAAKESKSVVSTPSDTATVSDLVSGEPKGALGLEKLSEQKEPEVTAESAITQTPQVSSSSTQLALATPTPTPGVAVSRVTRRARKCPETWQPKDDHWKLATERGVDLRAELTMFRDHDFGAPKSDWDSTFRNWLRRARPAAAAREPFLSEREKLERRLMAAASAGATAEGKTASIFGSLFTPAKDAAE